jgi:hypothetical protein
VKNNAEWKMENQTGKAKRKIAENQAEVTMQ